MKVSDKTKVLLAIGLFCGLKNDLNNRLEKCEDCKFTLEYVDYCLKVLNDNE